MDRRGSLTAYGGIYIAASLVWLWLIEGQAPTRTNLVGAALAISASLPSSAAIPEAVAE